MFRHNEIDHYLSDVMLFRPNPKSAEIFLYKARDQLKGLFSILNHHKCVSAPFENICYGSTDITKN